MLEWELTWYQIKLASYQLVCHEYPITCGQSESTEFPKLQPKDVTWSITSYLNRYFEHIGTSYVSRLYDTYFIPLVWVYFSSSEVVSGLTARSPPTDSKLADFHASTVYPDFCFPHYADFLQTTGRFLLYQSATLLNLLAMMLVFFCFPMWQ